MHVCDNPNIDLFHMNHLPTHSTNPYIFEMLKILNTYRAYSEDEKINYINVKSSLINEFKK